jgi:hypothetical protein
MGNMEIYRTSVQSPYPLPPFFLFAHNTITKLKIPSALRPTSIQNGWIGNNSSLDCRYSRLLLPWRGPTDHRAKLLLWRLFLSRCRQKLSHRTARLPTWTRQLLSSGHRVRHRTQRLRDTLLSHLFVFPSKLLFLLLVFSSSSCDF